MLKNWKEGEKDVQACRVNRRRRDKKIIVHTSICLCMFDWTLWAKMVDAIDSDPFVPFLNNIPNFLPSLQSTYIFKLQVPTQLFFYFKSGELPTCLCIPNPETFCKITWFSEKNGGHVLSRYRCWREWIPLPFS